MNSDIHIVGFYCSASKTTVCRFIMSAVLFFLLIATWTPGLLAIIEGNHVTEQDIVARAVVFIDNGLVSRREERYCSGFLVSRWHVMTVGNCCKW